MNCERNCYNYVMQWIKVHWDTIIIHVVVYKNIIIVMFVLLLAIIIIMVYRH